MSSVLSGWMTLFLGLALASPARAPLALHDASKPFLLREGETVELRLGDKVWTRSLVDGSWLDGQPASRKLDGGWEFESGTGGTRLLREGSGVTTLPRPPLEVVVDEGGIWLLMGLELRHIGSPRMLVDTRGSGVTSFAPFLGGVAHSRPEEVLVLNRHGRPRCRFPGRAGQLLRSPDGALLLALGEGGVSVHDGDCRLVAGAPTRGSVMGFLDADRLLVLGPERELILLHWPDLAVLHRTPPSVAASWELGAGPHGPVLLRRGYAFDPTTGITTPLPPAALVLRAQGLAFAEDEAGLRLLDLRGETLRLLPARLEGPPTDALVDGLRWVVTDGSVVIQALPDGRLDRWTLDLAVRRMRLLEEGAVEVMTEVGGPRRLLCPGAAPIPAPFLADPEDLRMPDGAGFPLLLGELSSVHAVYAAMGPAQVFVGAGLRALGPDRGPKRGDFGIQEAAACHVFIRTPRGREDRSNGTTGGRPQG